MPGRNVDFVRGRITPAQVGTHRPSYINALLIQSRGIVNYQACTECARRGLTPFPECISVAEHFGGCCGNCKWRDHGARCRRRPDPDSSDESNRNGDNNNRPPPRRRIIVLVDPRPAQLLLYGSVDSPIVL